MKETKSVGGSFTESQNINKSLLTLGELCRVDRPVFECLTNLKQTNCIVFLSTSNAI